MVKKSAGILAYRKKESSYQVFLVHPGGPFWAKKDAHTWSIPKGEFEVPEEPLKAAFREFREETGFDISGDFIGLNPVKQPSGKIIYTWAVEADFDENEMESNLFDLEWPPRSGKFVKFPEVDRGGWFTFPEAEYKIVKGQMPILQELNRKLEQP